MKPGTAAYDPAGSSALLKLVAYLAAAVLTAMYLGTPATQAANDGMTTVYAYVNASDSEPMDTGLYVTTGQDVAFFYLEGSWCMGGTPPDAECGSAAGIRPATPDEKPLVLDGAEFGELIGRVRSDDGSVSGWFRIGAGGASSMPRDGVLEVQFNDRPRSYDDNSGYIKVQAVTLSEPYDTGQLKVFNRLFFDARMCLETFEKVATRSPLVLVQPEEFLAGIPACANTLLEGAGQWMPIWNECHGEGLPHEVCSELVINWWTQAGYGDKPLRVESRVPRPPSAKRLSAGATHTCAVRAGTAWCWGSNQYGQLGDGTRQSRDRPVKVVHLEDVIAIGAGGDHSCAVRANGTVACWGSNRHGQLGDGTMRMSTTPVDLKGLGGATAVAAGDSSSCALLGDGTMSCWGSNAFGQLGTGTRERQPSPGRVQGLDTAVSIDTSGAHSCAVASDGDGWCWGHNFHGELGSWPAWWFGFGEPDRLEPAMVDYISPLYAISTGHDHTCALRTNGNVWCFGSTNSEQLGSDPARGWRPPPSRVEGLRSATGVDAGGYHTCALISGGTVRCWGNNDSGSLGDGSRLDRGDPVTVEGLEGVVELSAGGKHTCARKPDDSIWCWGNDGYGQVGDGDGRNNGRPVPVVFPEP